MIAGAVPSYAGGIGGDAMTMGPGARHRIPLGPKTRPPDGLPCPDRPRKMGLYGFDGGADGQEDRGKRRRASMCRFCHGSPQGVRGAYIK